MSWRHHKPEVETNHENVAHDPSGEYRNGIGSEEESHEETMNSLVGHKDQLIKKGKLEGGDKWDYWGGRETIAPPKNWFGAKDP